MKNDLLNALLHITLNGPAVNSPEAESLINRVTEDYSKQSHRKTPKIFTEKKIGNTMSTQTEVLEIDDNIVEDLLSKISEENEQHTNFLPTNMDLSDDNPSSDDSEDDEN